MPRALRAAGAYGKIRLVIPQNYNQDLVNSTQFRELEMYFLLNIYDSSYGDASSFDRFIFHSDDFGAMISAIAQRHRELIDDGTLAVEEQDWGQQLVSTDGNVVEANLTVFKSRAEADSFENGLAFTNTMFFNPSDDDQPISSSVDPDWLWDNLSYEDDALIASWGLTDFVTKKPAELSQLYELPLLEYFFNQLKSGEK